MSDKGTIILGAGPIDREVREALTAAENAGITVIFREDPPVDTGTMIHALTPLPQIYLIPKHQTTMNTKILNGILCIHDLPIDGSESNDGILFLHNEREPIGKLVKDFANYGKVVISYFVSDVKQTESDAVEALMKSLYGMPSADISSSGHAYSEVTPDLCWSHHNKFNIGGHDMNRELSGFAGKWVLLRICQQNGSLAGR